MKRLYSTFRSQFRSHFQELLRYGVAGVIVTVLNILLFKLFADYAGIHYLMANALAWLLGNIAAFALNKIVVFQSTAWDKAKAIKEAAAFFSFRGLSGLFDMAFIFLFVGVLSCDAVLSKIVDNVIVIAINYFAAKLIIFKKNTVAEETK
jgi:putative flippase GtrA